MSGYNMTLYGCCTSSATKRVRIALRLKRIIYDYVEVDLQQGEHLVPPYSELNAQKKLPLLVHGHQVLSQSLSIMEYLNELYPPHDLLPFSPEDRAWCRSFSALFASDYHPLVTRRVVDRLRTSGLNEKYIIDWKLQWLTESLSVAEDMLSQRSTQQVFCCNLFPTLGDICLYAQCESARKQGVELSHYENLFRIYTNCNKTDAFRETI